MAEQPDHRYSVDEDRCTCGGNVVWFDGKGEGCEVQGKPWAKPKPRKEERS